LTESGEMRKGERKQQQLLVSCLQKESPQYPLLHRLSASLNPFRGEKAFIALSQIPLHPPLHSGQLDRRLSLGSSGSTTDPPFTLPANPSNHPRLPSLLPPLQKMAMITLAGYPASGKTTRAQELVEYLNTRLVDPSTPPSFARLKPVLINDESLNLAKSVYDGAYTSLSPLWKRQLTSASQSRRPSRETGSSDPFQCGAAASEQGQHSHRRRHELHQGEQVPDVLCGEGDAGQDLHGAFPRIPFPFLRCLLTLFLTVALHRYTTTNLQREKRSTRGGTSLLGSDVSISFSFSSSFLLRS
jgi:hypothetical protein